MTTTATPANQTVVTHTITLASLASSATAGREGTAIDNGTDDAIDAMVGGFITTGTSPTANKQIEIWCYGSYDGTSFSGGASGSDAGLTPQAEGLMRLLTIIPTSSTSNQKYTFGPFSVAATFGGTMPRKWGIFVRHNTAVNLNATGSNHEIRHTPVKYESA